MQTEREGEKSLPNACGGSSSAAVRPACFKGKNEYYFVTGSFTFMYPTSNCQRAPPGTGTTSSTPGPDPASRAWSSPRSKSIRIAILTIAQKTPRNETPEKINKTDFYRSKKKPAVVGKRNPSIAVSRF